ncbi:hypothetical protein D3C87_1843510 [compost metagenome]
MPLHFFLINIKNLRVRVVLVGKNLIQLFVFQLRLIHQQSTINNLNAISWQSHDTFDIAGVGLIGVCENDQISSFRQSCRNISTHKRQSKPISDT